MQSYEHIVDRVSKVIREVHHSIDIITNVNLEWWSASVKSHRAYFQYLARHAAKHVRLRRIFMMPGKSLTARPWSKVLGTTEEIAKQFQDLGGDVRFVTGTGTRECLLADHNAAVISEITRDSADVRTFCVTNSQAILALQRYFDDLWSTGEDSTQSREVLYEDLLRSSHPKEEARIISIANEQWEPIIRYLSHNPDRLYSLTPREFEELIAELLLREGYKVHLTQVTRDGGKDLLVCSNTVVGEHLYLVECKRYAPHHRVGVSVVRELYGVVNHQGATAGLVVTTSSFTPEALAFREPIKWRLSLKDYGNVCDWIKKVQNVERLSHGINQGA